MRIWIIGSAVLFGGWFVYNYAPLLIPLAAVTAILAGVVAGIVMLTRRGRKSEPEDRS